MNYILYDDQQRENLLPFTFTRPVCEIRVGILTIREKWEKYLKLPVTTLTVDYLQEKFPLDISHGNTHILINGSVCPNEGVLEKIKSLKPGQVLTGSNKIIAIYSEEEPKAPEFDHIPSKFERIDLQGVTFIEYPWDIFSKNGNAIRNDFALLTKERVGEKLSTTNKLLGTEIFIEKGAVVECSILNAETGPIYIGKDAEVMEGSIIRGPFALCEHASVKMGAKIYGPTTIGPHSKVGGEVNNSVLFGYSNKAHDGFLGNSVIGEWCNLGADTNNSNLKNNYSNVRVWNYKTKKYEDTKLQFCGLLMGDHSKSGINTMFNTGTVVGVSSNIFGGGFPLKCIPSFSWGGADGFVTFELNKAIEVATNVYKRRNKIFGEAEKKIFKKIFEM